MELRHTVGHLTDRQRLYYLERWRVGNAWGDDPLPKKGSAKRTRDCFGRIAYASRQTADPPGWDLW